MTNCSNFPTERSLLGLKPEFREKVMLFFFLCPQVFITETTRTQARQDCLAKAGFSKVAQSLHQKGVAIDIAFRGAELYPKDHDLWREVADVAKKCKMDWGFDLWAWDKAHFQDNFEPMPDKQDVLHDYLEIAASEITPANRVFEEYEGDNYITERNVKLLIDIGINRARV